MGDLHHSRLIELHTVHGEELGQSKPFLVAREIQSQLLHGAKFRSVLLVGPGHGDEAEYLFSKTNINPTEVRIVACDLSDIRLDRFNRRFPEARTFVGDVLGAEFSAISKNMEPFDLIQMSFVLHDHSEENKALLLQTLFQLLRAGGLLLIADPTMPNYPNYLPRIPNAEALADVDIAFRKYFQTYIDEVSGWNWIGKQRKHELLESLRAGLRDALTHQDGREAFDTVPIYRERLRRAGFTDVELREGFNTIIVVLARKPGC